MAQIVKPKSVEINLPQTCAFILPVMSLLPHERKTAGKSFTNAPPSLPVKVVTPSTEMSPLMEEMNLLTWQSVIVLPKIAMES